jgi:hypothetical protein
MYVFLNINAGMFDKKNQPLHIAFLIKEAVDVYSRRAMSSNNF